MSEISSITLTELNRRIAAHVTVPDTQRVWVTAELSDVAIRGGHCYLELLEKNPENGDVIARARAIIWSSVYARLAANFYAATGQKFDTGLKVMVLGSVTMHPRYGLSVVITDVNPEYTMGDLLRRRREMLQRLQAEGILELNRNISWCEVPLRIAVISAPNAAGYGDFIHQLCNNQSRLHFAIRLFPAVMQGETAPMSIIAALEAIAAESGNWDGVVIIRGGGATSDLAAFENYDLAASIAQFPLPVMVGIGHERDVTILDYVANMRVKTPTAAAEWLISRGDAALKYLHDMGAAVVQAILARLSGYKEQISYFEGLVPTVPTAAYDRAASRLHSDSLSLASIGARCITPELARLSHIVGSFDTARITLMRRHNDRIDAMQELLSTLSPEATLRRGYSITRVNGKAVTSAKNLEKGTVLETMLADGKIISIKQ